MNGGATARTTSTDIENSNTVEFRDRSIDDKNATSVLEAITSPLSNQNKPLSKRDEENLSKEVGLISNRLTMITRINNGSISGAIPILSNNTRNINEERSYINNPMSNITRISGGSISGSIPTSNNTSNNTINTAEDGSYVNKPMSTNR